MDLLKFITCGSVDDGKSTLIGHMLYASKLLFADQEKTLTLESQIRSEGQEMDYSLLLDGLSAEREQGITIDVAYRYFHTEKRSFIVADTPGHEEYTRNMAVGASFAQLSLILIDATKGILSQTRRHLEICVMMGIGHFVFALNKMDLCDYDVSVYEKMVEEISQWMEEIPHASWIVIPVSAKEGEHMVEPSKQMLWYQGKPLLSYLEEIDVSMEREGQGFLLPVQRVSRFPQGGRGFQGQVVRGSLSVGELVTVLPSGEQGIVSQLWHGNKEVEEIGVGQAVTLSLEREVDCSRGCVLGMGADVEVSSFFSATLLWMAEEPLVVGRSYLLKLGTATTTGTVTAVYSAQEGKGERMSLREGRKNQILSCEIRLGEPMVLGTFSTCPDLGRFLWIDRVSHSTSACGIVTKTCATASPSLPRSEVTAELRASQKGQIPKTYWFTGLSGAGKSTLAQALEEELVAQGKHTMLLDGDILRQGLNENLGFSDSDRGENIRRIAQVCKLMNQAGLIVLVSVISPFARDREKAKEIIGDGFFEIYVSTSLAICEARDTKGLYAKARRGEIPQFTGISSPYEVPEQGDCVVETQGRTVAESLAEILKSLS